MTPSETSAGRGSRWAETVVMLELENDLLQVIKMLILVVVLFLLCWGPRFIMETALKMQVLQFNNYVYWVRVGLFLLPFLHSISNKTL